MHADRFLEGNKTLNALFLNKVARFPGRPLPARTHIPVPVSFVFCHEGQFIRLPLYASARKCMRATGNRLSKKCCGIIA